MKIIHIESLDWCVLKEENGDLAYSPLDKEKAYSVKNKTFKVRSIKVNASLHVYCLEVAEALNDGGFTVNSFLNRKQEDMIKEVFKWGRETASNKLEKWFIPKKITDWVSTYFLKKLEERILDRRDLELDWSMQLVKDIIWRNIQIALFKDKTSTTQLSSGEVTQVYKTMDKYLSSLGVESIDFPSEQSMIFKQNYKGL